MEIEFSKLSGAGNDFIIVDNTSNRLSETDIKNISKACRRGMSVGADGYIVVGKSPDTDFRMRFFNADGTEANMCGNGSRCVSRFAYLKGIAGKEMTFASGAGVHRAWIDGSDVKVTLTGPDDLISDIELEVMGEKIKVSTINTGTEHLVYFVEDLENFDVYNWGKALRYHERFAPIGLNVNFGKVTGPKQVRVRTYERGVEDETQACGTGSMAVAIIAAINGHVRPPVEVITSGGPRLTVDFKQNNGEVTDLMLAGEARLIFDGKLSEEAFE
jgi:diaminopimelate epimerase